MKNKQRKYEYDETFFENIDSSSKAYWLGFIVADGYIMNNRKKDNKSQATGLRIRLSEKDKEHLEKFNDDMKSNVPIIIVKNYGVYANQNNLVELCFYSKDIVESLNSLGVTSGNKSCNEKFINFESKSLTKNFILGLFDGDGSITVTDKSLEWSICSSLTMVEGIIHFLENELNIKFTKISPGCNHSEKLFRIRTSSKKSIKKLYEYFY